MANVVSGAVQISALQDIVDGRIFLFPDGEGHLVCMASRGPAGHLIVVFGGRGVQEGKPGYFEADYHLGTECILLPSDLEFELLPTKGSLFGLALPVSGTSNGSIVLDSSEDAWVQVAGERTGSAYFNLKTGEAGSPGIGRIRFKSWRLIWRKPNQKEPVEIYRHE